MRHWRAARRPMKRARRRLSARLNSGTVPGESTEEVLGFKRGAAAAGSFRVGIANAESSSGQAIVIVDERTG
jgi:hypothetical protein